LALARHPVIPSSRHPAALRAAGFTLWELTMVLLILAITATLAAPAIARLGEDQPEGSADRVIALLRDTRKLALENHTTTILRMDPKTLRYQVDTIGFSGAGLFTSGKLDLDVMQSLVTDRPRLQFIFRPTGVAFADSVVVRGGERPLMLRVDPWSGVARADTL
jgi:prepilin-type N-terminal cleavage/methylation domain-containing protein